MAQVALAGSGWYQCTPVTPPTSWTWARPYNNLCLSTVLLPPCRRDGHAGWLPSKPSKMERCNPSGQTQLPHHLSLPGAQGRGRTCSERVSALQQSQEHRLAPGALGAHPWAEAHAGQVWQRSRCLRTQRMRLCRAEPQILGKAGLHLLHDYSLHCKAGAEISTHGTCRLVLQRLWGDVSAACHVTVCLEECAGVSFGGLLGLSCPVFPWKSPFCLQGPGRISGLCKTLHHTAHAVFLPAAYISVSVETSVWG